MIDTIKKVKRHPVESMLAIIIVGIGSLLPLVYQIKVDVVTIETQLENVDKLAELTEKHHEQIIKIETVLELHDHE